MEQAYFSEIRSIIISYINNATTSIQVAMAWFTSNELFDALLNALSRRVNVDIVLLDNAINFMYYAPDFNKLLKAGGKLRIAKVEDGFMHHKFCIIDNSIVITGSYNWTYYAETRNIENIIITDDKNIIDSYKKEFANLSCKIDATSKSPRLDWCEIELSQHLNFDELNYEIENISKVQNLPVRKVVKTSKPIVEIINTPLNPVSRFDIGIILDEDIKKLIEENTTLPYTKTYDFKSYEDERKNVCFVLACWNDDPSQDCELFNYPISKLTDGKSDWMLNIQVQITLDNTGYLHVSISCVQTGKTLNLQDTNKKYVKYES